MRFPQNAWHRRLYLRANPYHVEVLDAGHIGLCPYVRAVIDEIYFSAFGWTLFYKDMYSRGTGSEAFMLQIIGVFALISFVGVVEIVSEHTGLAGIDAVVYTLIGVGKLLLMMLGAIPMVIIEAMDHFQQVMISLAMAVGGAFTFTFMAMAAYMLIERPAERLIERIKIALNKSFLIAVLRTAHGKVCPPVEFDPA